LLATVRLPDGLVAKWFGRAGVDAWEDMPTEAIGACIEFTRARLPAPPQPVSAPPARPDYIAEEIRELLEARNFSDADRLNAVKEFLKGYEVFELVELKPEQRQQLKAAILSGKADKFRMVEQPA
jgi:hypothetical protein